MRIASWRSVVKVGILPMLSNWSGLNCQIQSAWPPISVANSVLAARAGAKQIDGSTRRFGAGAGNTPVEAFAAVTERLGITTGIDTVKIIDAAEETVAPVLESNPPALNRLSLTMGYAGVYSSFLKHAEIQAKKYGVSGAEILIEAGRRKLVGGQEDQLIEIAVGLAKRR